MYLHYSYLYNVDGLRSRVNASLFSSGSYALRIVLLNAMYLYLIRRTFLIKYSPPCRTLLVTYDCNYLQWLTLSLQCSFSLNVGVCCDNWMHKAWCLHDTNNNIDVNNHISNHTNATITTTSNNNTNYNNNNKINIIIMSKSW